MNRLAWISACLTGGAIGALINSLVVWGAGEIGLTLAAGAKIAPALTLPWLYQRLVWGALWGLLFLVPFQGGRRRSNSVLAKGLLISLAPTLAQLFYFFPEAGQGLGGLRLGVTVPVFVIVFNAIWGWVAAGWVALAEGWRLRRRWFTV